MEFNHVSVLLEEVINSLQVKPSGCYIDCTVGGGGHSFHIAQQLDPKLGGRLWGIDQDECALLAASERLAPFGDTVHLVRDNFSNLASVASEHGIGQADGILLDLGVSSYQLDTPERGFSYIHNAPLDMRMDDRSALTAAVIVNTYPEHEIADIISRFGEERFARKIAARICEIRADAPIETTSQLADICRSVISAHPQQPSAIPQSVVMHLLFERYVYLKICCRPQLSRGAHNSIPPLNSMISCSAAAPISSGGYAYCLLHISSFVTCF